MAVSRPRYNQKRKRYSKKRGEPKFKQGYFIDISEMCQVISKFLFYIIRIVNNQYAYIHS